MAALDWFEGLSFPAMWLMWGLYWLIQSRRVKANVWAESGPYRLDERFLPPSPAIFCTGFALTAAGLLFTVWARRHLAANWSAERWRSGESCESRSEACASCSAIATCNTRAMWPR